MFGADIQFTENTDCQQRIIAVCSSHFTKTGTWPSRRDIVRETGKRYDSKMIDDTLKVMLSLEILNEEKPPQSGRGRPSMRYSVVS